MIGFGYRGLNILALDVCRNFKVSIINIFQQNVYECTAIICNTDSSTLETFDSPCPQRRLTIQAAHWEKQGIVHMR